MSAGRPPSLLGATWVLVRKDLLLEWRTRARANALVFFALATLLLFSFALGPDTTVLRRAAGGTLWLAVLLASVLALGESFRWSRKTQPWTACGWRRRMPGPSFWRSRWPTRCC